jgi:hypothetical protein
MLSLRKIGITLFILFFVSEVFSQSNLLQVKRCVNHYFADTLYYQIEFTYKNNSEKTFVVWIEKDSIGLNTNNSKIRKHFYTQHNDWSLIQLIWDGNVESFIPDVFDMFFKVIRPNEQFVIAFLDKGNNEYISDLMKALENKIVIINAQEIKGFPIDSRIDMFNHKGESITILTEWLNLAKK